MSALWSSWLQAAILRFGLSPSDFWALSLSEWRALTHAAAGPAPLSRADLDALLAYDQETCDDRA